jgi:hypothetical protein
MKVSEFKKLVAAIPDEMNNAQVILQKDSEGNGYSPLSCVDTDAAYVKESEYSGQVYALKWTADEACLEEKDWTKIKKKNRCVVLAPIN